MSFEAAIGFGGKLEIDTAYPGTPAYTDVGQVVDFGLSPDVAEVDVTHQQSATSAPYWAEFIPGKVSVEANFNCIFDPGAAQHQATILDFLGQEKTWRYTFPDDKGTGNSEWTFGGFYRTPNISIPNEDKRSADVTIRVTGAPTFAGTAAT